MSKVFSDVHVFMHSAGQDVPPFNANRSDQSDLYFELIKEEYKELMDASIDKNDTEICDACFDLMWVIVGYMKSRGWDCENIWDEGAQSNLSKIDPVTLRVKRREDGKILKPEGWKPPDFAKFVK
jgi:phosphoribosyl-ATP pyrophosphohydrolase